MEPHNSNLKAHSSDPEPMPQDFSATNYCGVLSFGCSINKKKRKHVKVACTNCRKAKAACSAARPCKRCITHNIKHTCRDSERKKNRAPPKNCENS